MHHRTMISLQTDKKLVFSLTRRGEVVYCPGQLRFHIMTRWRVMQCPGRRRREEAGLGGMCWAWSSLNTSVIDEVTSSRKETSTWLLSADLEDWCDGIVMFEDESDTTIQRAARHIT